MWIRRTHRGNRAQRKGFLESSLILPAIFIDERYLLTLSTLIPRPLKPLFRLLRPYYLPLIIKSPRGEPSLYFLLPKYIRKEDVVVEVGANMGACTLVLCRIAKYVHALEPNPRTFKYLENFVRVRGRENVSLYNVGLSDKPKKAWLRYNQSNISASASIFEQSNAKYSGQIAVSLTTLDSLELNPRPSVLLFDCEGSEIEALHGALRTIQGSVREVLVESHNLKDGKSTLVEAKNFLESLGFESETFVDGDGIPWIQASRG